MNTQGASRGLAVAAIVSLLLCIAVWSGERNRAYAGNSGYSADLTGFWNNESYWVQDTTDKIGVNLGSNGLFFPDFVKVGNEYLAFYNNNSPEGYDHTDSHGINMAKTTDGIHFTDYGEVIAPGPGDMYTAFPGAWYENGTIHLVHERNNYGQNFNIAYATSTDGGHTFTKLGDILTEDHSYWYETQGIGTPDLYKVDGTWYLFYHSYDGNAVYINVATGTSLNNLTRSPLNPIIRTSLSKSEIDSGTVGRRSIEYYDGYYYMGYEVSSAPVPVNGWGDYGRSNWSSTLARSSDLIHWEKYAQSSVIPWRTPAWGNDGTALVMIGNTPYLYVRDYNDAGVVWAKRYRLANDTSGGGFDLSFEAEAMQHDIGQPVPDGWRADPASDAAGYLVSGPPQANMPGGENLAIFKARIDDNTVDDSKVLRLEVYDNTSNALLVGREITRKQFKQANHDEFFILPYQSMPGHSLKFRTYWYATAPIVMDRVMVKFNDEDAHRYPVEGGSVSLLKTFEAEGSYTHEIGALSEAGTAWSANTTDDSPGFLVSGQQAADIPAGAGHIAAFKLKIDNNSFNDEKVADLEVFDRNTGTLLAQRPIFRKEFVAPSAYQDFYVTFSANGIANSLDFRVHWEKQAAMAVDSIKVYGVGRNASDGDVVRKSFNDASDGLLGWVTTLNKGSSANWTVESGELSGQTPAADQSFAMTGSPTGYLDYSLEAKVKIVSNPGIGGLVFRATSNRDFYLLQIRGDGVAANRLELYKCVNGAYTSLASANPSVAIGQWYKYRIEAVGSSIQVFRNDTLLMTVTDDAHYRGMVGANVTSASHVHFDNFVIKQINVAPQAVVSSSSEYDNWLYTKRNAVDGPPGKEWASNGELNPWIRLDWATPKQINKIVLRDRFNLTDAINGGTLSFSDGTTIPVTNIPNDGSEKVLTFADKSVTWVKFQATSGTGYNNGLGEFQVFRDPG
ncbi:DUF7402 domain-containing protein [Cohnella hashimotonis]|uniref:DUF1080 domain-containing protein n=1 Tax=Cohnella hashimotonis TaxID=2826895 RepID=A0ABT6TCX3_9BACL|nr:family 16 glycoside hydrolase [Cohnella hashimotonis]MDI4643692.1 DUF1080 domain-containing protein [Cohnella hashimotonis]